jgi:uncharacterized protein
MTTTQPAVLHDVHWKLDYRVRLGQAWSRFMRGLQEEKLLGSRCDSCDRTYVPPQSYCESCFEAIEEWVELEPVGTIGAATIVYQGFEGGPKAPYAVAGIHIDGTDTLFMHFVGGVDLSDETKARDTVKGGARVRAVWAKEREAAITDIEYFAIERA